MPEFGFIGGSYQSFSPNVDAQRSLNLFPERIESAGTPAKYSLYGTPGIAPFMTLPTSPVRGIWEGGGRVFVVAGSKLYEISITGTIIGLGGPTDHTARGDVGNDGLPVQMFPNGNQLLIVSAGNAYVDGGAGPVLATIPPLTGTVNTAGFGITWVSGDQFDQSWRLKTIVIAGTPYAIVAVVSPTLMLSGLLPTLTGAAYSYTAAVGASSGAFLDGYFAVSIPNTKQFNISAINDGTTWNPLDFAVKEAYPDNIVSLLSDHEELWIFGTDTTEVWRNTGENTFPLERDPSGFIQMGCVAPATPVRLQAAAGAGVAWLGGDPRGGAVAYLAVGFIPQRVSTHAIEAIWAAYSTVADAVSYTYQDGGHNFWVLNFPTANATWVYDATESYWHERGWWNGASVDRQRQMFHAFGFGQHLVGDWQNGNIYTMSMSVYTDAGTQIYRQRAASEPIRDLDWIFHKRFRLDAENSGALNPSLDWSIDGGHTWNTPRTTTSQAAGALAVYDYRRLGRSRARVWRITITAAVKVALVNAFTEVQ